VGGTVCVRRAGGTGTGGQGNGGGSGGNVASTDGGGDADAAASTDGGGDAGADASPCDDGGACVVAAAAFAGDLAAAVLDGTSLYLAESRTLGRILHVSLESGVVRTLASDQPMPAGLAVDGTHVYWSNSAEGSPRPGAGAVMKVAKSGGAPITLAGMLYEPRGIAVDGADVFFATWADGNLRRIDKQGASALVITDGQSSPRAVAVDGTHVYWGNFGAGDTTIKKALRGGGGVVSLAEAGGSPIDIALDDGRVYWLAYGTRAVRSVAKEGGSPMVLAPGADGTGAAAGSHGLAVDADHVYWLDSFKLSRVATTGGATTVVFTGSALGGLAVGTSVLYFGQGMDIVRIDKPPR
jgi:hypothetical protein